MPFGAGTPIFFPFQARTVDFQLAFEATGFSPFAARFRERDVLDGREVVLSDGQHGVARGVDAGGALLVHTAAGLQRITSSEVSVRPRPV